MKPYPFANESTRLTHREMLSQNQRVLFKTSNWQQCCANIMNGKTFKCTKCDGKNMNLFVYKIRIFIIFILSIKFKDIFFRIKSHIHSLVWKSAIHIILIVVYSYEKKNPLNGWIFPFQKAVVFLSLSHTSQYSSWLKPYQKNEQKKPVTARIELVLFLTSSHYMEKWRE